jgi:hypothetical protein
VGGRGAAIILPASNNGLMAKADSSWSIGTSKSYKERRKLEIYRENIE